MNRLIFFFICVSFLITDVSSADSSRKKAETSLYDTGNIYLLRHALAPGTGDPDNFDVDDCDTQRNLSEEGRGQAVRIGKTLRDNLKKIPHVFSSQWCRCKETAQILNLGAVTELPILNSFFENFHLKDNQTNQLKEWLSKHINKTPIILVTHQVNITALTGVYPSSGEIVVIRMGNVGGVQVDGRIPPD